jgi:anthranilate synthase component 1
MLLEATKTQTPPALQSVVREINADLETPVSLYLKLRGDGASFLLESVEGGERIARYSFIGVQPRAEYILRDGQVEIKENGETRTIQLKDDPTRFLQEEMSRFSMERLPNAPRFTGGLVGYLSYESVRYFEPTLNSHFLLAERSDHRERSRSVN